MSRTRNSIKNIFFGIGGQLVSIILQFVTRTVFIRVLGREYLGISSLFTNILSILSLAELGVGSAIVFNLYKPIADGDKKHICQLIQLYKKAYHIIGIVITLIGLILVPFLNIIIKKDISYVNISVVYILYLIQTVASYFFFAYKRALLEANQKEYIVSLVGYVTTILSNIVQMVVLLLTKNFMAYLVVVVSFVIINNILVGWVCDKIYSYAKLVPDEPLPKAEIHEIYKNCSAIFIYKINGVILNATDNIILSQITGILSVGSYSNYHMIFNTINIFMTRIFVAIKASIGNLHASSNLDYEEMVFRRINFATFMIFTVASVGVACLGNEFIKIWLGDEYLFGIWMSILIAIKLYIEGLKKLLSSFREAMGLFQQSKYRPLVGAIINLIVSIIAVKICGVYGVVIGTIVADLSTYMWFDPYIIYRYGFKKSVKNYGKNNIIYVMIFISITIFTMKILSLIALNGIFGFLIKVTICFVISFLIIAILFYRSNEFKYFKNLVFNIMKKKI